MKTVRIVQRWFIPMALVSANAGFVHLMYLLSVDNAATHLFCVLFCLSIILTGVLRKSKYILVLGSIVYWLLFFSAIFGLM
jgi:inner membrane protein involved in colicin E2 resistance